MRYCFCTYKAICDVTNSRFKRSSANIISFYYSVVLLLKSLKIFKYKLSFFFPFLCCINPFLHSRFSQALTFQKYVQQYLNQSLVSGLAKRLKGIKGSSVAPLPTNNLDFPGEYLCRMHVRLDSRCSLEFMNRS